MDGGVCRLLLREGEGIGKVLGDFSSSGGCTMLLALGEGIFAIVPSLSRVIDRFDVNKPE
jgi:hypothetical protein